MIVLVVVTIGLLWWVGYQKQKERGARLEQFTKEFLDKQKSIEAVTVKGLQNDEMVATPIEKLPQIIISTSTASSTEQLHNYILTLTKAFKPLGLERENEVQAVMDAIDKNDSSLLRPVIKSRIYHQTTAQNLAQVIVPKEMATQHKKIIGDLNFIASILSNMEKAVDQPQSALNNSKSFISNYLIFLKSIDDLNKYSAEKDPKFSSLDKIKIFVSFSQ